MTGNLDFICREDFTKHVENTVAEYGQNLEPDLYGTGLTGGT